MTREPRSPIAVASRRASIPIAWLVIALGLVVLAGWHFELDPLRHLIPRQPAVSPLTALSLILLGAALLLRLRPSGHAPAQRVGTVLAGVVIAIGIAHSVDLSGGGPDEALLRWLSRTEPHGDPGGLVHMDPTSGVALMLLGFAVAAMDARGRVGWWPAQLSAAVAMLAPITNLTSALLDLSVNGIAVQSAPIAVPSALAFAATGTAVLLARPDGGVVQLALGKDFGSRAFRWMFLAAHLIPFTLGWLRLWGQRQGWFDDAQGVALTTGFTVFVLLASSWLVARLLDRTHRALRATERALEHSRRRLDFAVHAVGIGTFEWDLVTGTTAGDEMADRLWDFASDDPRTVKSHLARLGSADAERFRRLFVAGPPSPLEQQLRVRVVDAGCGERWIGLLGVTTRDTDSRAIRFEGVCWDATAEHEAEEARQRAQQKLLEQKDQFLSHASHELRSPLAAIYEFVGILRDGIAGPLNAEQRDFADIALRNARELRGMIDDLLDMTRLDSGKISLSPRCVDLASIVRDVVGSLRAAADEGRVALCPDLPVSSPRVLADPHRTRQVLVNLLENALKFTPEGGSIHIGIASRAEDGMVRVTVTDSGCGIPPGELERIFEPLHQVEQSMPRSRRGLGLGLAICREMVTRQGGRLWVESEVGNGSRFHFTLPSWSLERALVPLGPAALASGGEGILVHVEMEPLDARPLGPQDGRAVAAAWRDLSASLPPDHHALLPPNEQAPGSLLLVSFADPDCLAALAAKVRVRLDCCDELKNVRLHHEVWTSPLRLPLGSKAATPEVLAAHMAELVNGEAATEPRRRMTA